MDWVKIVSFVIPVSGYRKRFRRWLWKRIYGGYARRVAKVAESCRFEGRAKLNSATEIKEGTAICGLEIVGSGRVTIGRYCRFAPEVLILTQNHDYDNGECIPYGRKNIEKNVEISDFVWIGQRVVILPGAKIGEGAIIQAGSVVHGEIPPMAIAGGNPAKVFANRNVEHFHELKEQGRFA